MLVDRPCRGRQSQERASVAETIDTDVGDTSHGPTRKLALSEPPSNASAEINAAWCDLVCGAKTSLNRRSMTMLIKITLIFALAIAVTSAAPDRLKDPLRSQTPHLIARMLIGGPVLVRVSVRKELIIQVPEQRCCVR